MPERQCLPALPQRDIRIQVSDRYLGNPESDQSNKLASEIPQHLFHEPIMQAAAIVDRTVADWD